MSRQSTGVVRTDDIHTVKRRSGCHMHVIYLWMTRDGHIDKIQFHANVEIPAKVATNNTASPRQFLVCILKIMCSVVAWTSYLLMSGGSRA